MPSKSPCYPVPPCQARRKNLISTFALLCFPYTSLAQIGKNNASASNDVPYQVFFDPSQKVREAALEKLAMPFDFIDRHAQRLSKDSSPLIRNRVAQFSRNPEILAKLAHDADDLVRKCVAKNMATPPDVLIAMAKKLAETPDEHDNGFGMSERESFATFSLMENLNFPAEGFTHIASFYPLAYRMEPHRNMPLDIAMRYLTADYPWEKGEPEYDSMIRIKSLLGKPVDMLTAMAKSQSNDFISISAMHAQTPPDVLEWIAARDKRERWNGGLLESIALNAVLGSNHPTIVKLVATLATHKSEEVRRNLYKNPDAPVETLRREAQNKRGELREEAARTLWLMHGEMV